MIKLPGFVRQLPLALIMQALVMTTACAAESQTGDACPGPARVTVFGGDTADFKVVCEGAQRALAFLSRAGLQNPHETVIDVVAELSGELAGRAVGCYLRETRRIQLLSFAAFQSGGGWFQLPPTLELYRAAASHEAAHAVAGCHAEPRRLAVAAHEYLAYVVMFATLDPVVRSAVLAKFPSTGFGSAGQITDISHIANPNQFGVDAWRHYLRMRDRETWLRSVLAGDVVPDIAEDPGADTR